jgi:hypothetical protein
MLPHPSPTPDGPCLTPPTIANSSTEEPYRRRGGESCASSLVRNRVVHRVGMSQLLRFPWPVRKFFRTSRWIGSLSFSESEQSIRLLIRDSSVCHRLAGSRISEQCRHFSPLGHLLRRRRQTTRATAETKPWPCHSSSTNDSVQSTHGRNGAISVSMASRDVHPNAKNIYIYPNDNPKS